MTTPSQADESFRLAEQARDNKRRQAGFAGGLFLGRFQASRILPFPEPSAEEERRGDEFLERLEAFLRRRVDADAIEQAREIPAGVMAGLAELGCFGMKIPVEYGGLGLSQANYDRAMALLASHCSSTAVTLSVHQSVGLPEPLLLFGTPEQKRRYLPRLAKGALSAFALTEPEAGSDPARMACTASPVEGGAAYRLNGEKLWCTNGPRAELMVVLAVVPAKGITAFIVETAWPGFSVAHRCDFIGLKGIQNGLLKFMDLRVPAENVLWGEGLGLKLALITVDTGRLTLPAAWSGVAKQALTASRSWAGQRRQWGRPIAGHEAISSKLAWMAAHTFAMEAATWLASGLADLGEDIRVEAAMAKIFSSEACWQILDQAVQIRGGRGIETEASLRARGEQAVGLERLLRDARANTIIEGTSEILRLFLAREAVDEPLRLAGGLLRPGLGWWARLGMLARAGLAAAAWYPGLLRPSWFSFRGMPGSLGSHLRWAESSSRRLARALFAAILRHRAELQDRQVLLGRLVDIGTDLFVMAAVCSRAEAALRRDPADRSCLDLADFYCRLARARIQAAFRALAGKADEASRQVAGQLMAGRYRWLEDPAGRRQPQPRPASSFSSKAPTSPK